MSDVVLEDFFNALSFVTRKANETSFARSEMLQYARDAAKFVDAGDIQKMLADIIEITCMIVTDGDEARFIHKSVQEYNAALFIKRQPDESARKFYEAMATRWETWTQELRFLESIDRYRFLKFFHIPSLERLFSSIGVDENATDIDVECVRRFCGKDSVWVVEEGVRAFSIEGSRVYWPTSPNRGFHLHHMVALCEKVSDLLKNAPSIPVRKRDRDMGAEVSIEDLLNFEAGGKIAGDILAQFLLTKLGELRQAREVVARVEETRGVFDFSAARAPGRGVV